MMIPKKLSAPTTTTAARNLVRLPRMQRFGKLALSVLCMGALASTATALDTYNYRGVCPAPNGGKRIASKLNFWECECADSAADKLNEKGVPFWWGYKNVQWWGASNWLNAAAKSGTPYNRTPRRGDVAWWSHHVAYVEAVDSYRNVTISEYNFGAPYNYHTRTIKRGAPSYPKYFIHF